MNKDGSSPRANTQVNKLNKESGYPKYDSRVVIIGIPDRVQGLQKESENALRLKNEGNSMSIHKRPCPWED